MDYVPNHTSTAPLVRGRGLTQPHRDWYVWADAGPDGAPPNNWLSVFGGPAWDGTAQRTVLPAPFLAEQPDLNWRNPQVKAAMLDVLRFWLDRGVDGFRIDVRTISWMIHCCATIRRTRRHASLHKSLGAYDRPEHLYDKDHPTAMLFTSEFRQLLDAYSEPQPRFVVGEIHIFDWKDVGKLLRRGPG